MKKLKLGVLLILMLFGHNYVLNQTQTMQKPLEQIHQINVTQFNLLYSIPSAISILFIIPLGFFYNKITSQLLWGGAIAISVGQLLVAIFGGQGKPLFYELLMAGRIFQAIGAQILYMLQGSMASSWMGQYAGVVFILPQFGEIANVFITPWTYTKFGVNFSFFLGFLTCAISSASCIAIYYALKKSHNLTKSSSEEDIKNHADTINPPSIEMNNQTKPNSPNQISKLTENEQTQDTELLDNPPASIFQAGKITWLVLILCGINECLYFPFLDNANQLVINRFCIPYEKTGYYLSIPFIAAMITSAVSSLFIPKVQRHKLIFYISVLPLIGHSLIFLDINCQLEPTIFEEAMLVLGMTFFGIGIGSYYSVSFPAVGLSVPSEIRGMAYACMAFFQTISMTVIPIFAGMIIQSQQRITKLSQGYREQSLLFVVICLIGVVISFLIKCFGNSTSFKYNDQQQLEKQDKQLIKESTSQNQIIQ